MCLIVYVESGLYLLCDTKYSNILLITNVCHCASLVHSASNDDIQGLGRWAMGDGRRFPNVIFDRSSYPCSPRGCRFSTFFLLLRPSPFPNPPPACSTGKNTSVGSAGAREDQGMESDSQQHEFRHVSRRLFEALTWLKVVFLQDMALLQVLHPDLPVFKHEVFLLPEWGPFASEVRSVDTAAAHEVSDV